MSRFFHSIRWRVQAWHGAILLVVILAFCVTAYRLAWDNQMRAVDRAIEQADHALVRALFRRIEEASGGQVTVSPARLGEMMRQNSSVPAEVAALFSRTDPGFIYFSVRDAEGHVVIESANVPREPDFWDKAPSPGPLAEESRVRHGRRELVKNMPGEGRAIFGMDLQLENQEMRRFAISIGALGLAVWLLGLLGGWWLAGRAMKPVARISRTATRIAEGNLAERISTEGTDSELDQLSRVLNETFSRLHGAFERQRQFTADASHELRTPVTILIAETERMLKRERTSEEYRAALTTCHDTAVRMSQLIEALLFLARQETAGVERPRKRVDLGEVLRETAAQLAPVASARGMKLVTALEACACTGDPASLSILATNLVGNAIQHHDRTAGTIILSSGVADGGPFFSVTDDGPGIPAEALPNIFDRFFRVDQARTEESGHTGLGLAIAKTIVQNHGGTIVAENLAEGRGCRFIVRLPGTADAGKGTRPSEPRR